MRMLSQSTSRFMGAASYRRTPSSRSTDRRAPTRGAHRALLPYRVPASGLKPPCWGVLLPLLVGLGEDRTADRAETDREHRGTGDPYPLAGRGARDA